MMEVKYMKKILALFIIILAGLSGVSVYAYDGYCGPDNWGYGPMPMHYWYGGGMFMGLLFLAVIGLLIYFIIRAMRMKDQIPTHEESALDILKKRYARGEVTKDEFETMKKDLEK